MVLTKSYLNDIIMKIRTGFSAPSVKRSETIKNGSRIALSTIYPRNIPSAIPTGLITLSIAHSVPVNQTPGVLLSLNASDILRTRFQCLKYGDGDDGRQPKCAPLENRGWSKQLTVEVSRGPKSKGHERVLNVYLRQYCHSFRCTTIIALKISTAQERCFKTALAGDRFLLAWKGWGNGNELLTTERLDTT